MNRLHGYDPRSSPENMRTPGWSRARAPDATFTLHSGHVSSHLPELGAGGSGSNVCRLVNLTKFLNLSELTCSSEVVPIIKDLCGLIRAIVYIWHSTGLCGSSRSVSVCRRAEEAVGRRKEGRSPCFRRRDTQTTLGRLGQRTTAGWGWRRVYWKDLSER